MIVEVAHYDPYLNPTEHLNIWTSSEVKCHCWELQQVHDFYYYYLEYVTSTVKSKSACLFFWI